MDRGAERNLTLDLDLFCQIRTRAQKDIPNLRDEFTSSTEVSVKMRGYVRQLEEAIFEAEDALRSVDFDSIVGVLEGRVTKIYFDMGDLLTNSRARNDEPQGDD